MHRNMLSEECKDNKFKTKEEFNYFRHLDVGMYAVVQAYPELSTYTGEVSMHIVNMKKSNDVKPITTRVDTEEKKRVELHCHTKMSDMDGISEVSDLVKRAYKWGHKALAVTDHGVVQSFPDANHTWEDLWKVEKKKRIDAGEEKPDRQDFFKVIYGVEGYLVDDLLETVLNSKNQSIFWKLNGCLYYCLEI